MKQQHGKPKIWVSLFNLIGKQPDHPHTPKQVFAQLGSLGLLNADSMPSDIAYRLKFARRSQDKIEWNRTRFYSQLRLIRQAARLMPKYLHDSKNNTQANIHQ